MVRLDHFIGDLVKNVAQAVLLVDKKAVEIAELYKDDQYMNRFQTPKMVIESTELNAKVAFRQISKIPIMDKSSKKAIQDAVYVVVMKQAYPLIRPAGIDPTPARQNAKEMSQWEVTKNQLAEQIYDRYLKDSQFVEPDKFARDTREIFEANLISFVNAAEKDVNKRGLFLNTQKEIHMKAFEVEIQKSLEAFVNLPVTPQTGVIIDSGELSNLRPDLICTLKINIKQEGLAWYKMEDSEGKEIQILDKY